jgi:hypothetical protein
MKTKKDLKAQIDELQAQYDAMTDDIGRIALNESEAVCCIYGYGYGGVHPLADVQYLNKGNAFTTYEAAERQGWINIQRQKARVAMAADWGDVERDWDDRDQCKYVIDCENKRLNAFCAWHFLAFRTTGAREAFTNNYSEQEIIMIARGE